MYIYVYMYVCVCVCVCVCVYIHTYIHTYIHVWPFGFYISLLALLPFMCGYALGPSMSPDTPLYMWQRLQQQQPQPHRTQTRQQA